VDVCQLFAGDFAEAVWSNFLGSLAAGTIIAAAAYFIIDRRLRRTEQRHARQELVAAVLREVRRELEHDRRQARILLEHVPHDELPVPLFDVNGWTLLMQADVLTALDAETLEILVKTYNRLRTSNDQWSVASDLHAGPSAVIAYGLGTLVQAAMERFTTHRRAIFKSLAGRVEELVPVLDDALAAVDSQLASIAASAPRKRRFAITLRR
jgi:hypothetical protein